MATTATAPAAPATPDKASRSESPESPQFKLRPAESSEGAAGSDEAGGNTEANDAQESLMFMLNAVQQVGG